MNKMAKIKMANQYDELLRSRVHRLYNKSAPMLIVEAILFLLAGVVMLVCPVGVLTAIIFIFGCILMLLGLYRMVSGFIVSHKYGGGWLDVIFGLLNILMGVLFLAYPMGSIVSLTYVFIILFVVGALRALVFAINMVRARFGHYVLNLIMSIIMLGISVALLFFPKVGAVAIVVYLAVILLFCSMADFYMYWILRRLKKNVVG